MRHIRRVCRFRSYSIPVREHHRAFRIDKSKFVHVLLSSKSDIPGSARWISRKWWHGRRLLPDRFGWYWFPSIHCHEHHDLPSISRNGRQSRHCCLVQLHGLRTPLPDGIRQSGKTGRWAESDFVYVFELFSPYQPESGYWKCNAHQTLERQSLPRLHLLPELPYRNSFLPESESPIRFPV